MIELPNIESTQLLAIDLETDDPNLLKTGTNALRSSSIGSVLGISLAWQKDPNDLTSNVESVYYSFGHDLGNNVTTPADKLALFQWINDRMILGGHFVMWNGQYDLKWLYRLGIFDEEIYKEMYGNGGRFYDGFVSRMLLDNGTKRGNCSLDSCAKDAGFSLKKSEELIGYLKERGAATHEVRTKKQAMSKIKHLAGYEVAAYAERDAELHLRCWHWQRPLIKNAGLQVVDTLEQKVMPILALMSIKGVKIDENARQEVSMELGSDINRIRNTLRNLYPFDEDVNCNTSKSLTKCLQWIEREKTNELVCQGLDEGVQVRLCKREHAKYIFRLPRTKTGKISTSAKDIKLYLNDPNNDGNNPNEIPLLTAIMLCRTISKLKGTFVDKALIDFQDERGYLHPNFNQLKSYEGGARTGRLSCSNPNEQQVPKRNPKYGKKIRLCHTAPEGYLWASLDFKSQEPRVTAHIAKLWERKGWERIVNTYRNNPMTDPHQMVADWIEQPKSKGKVINLGIGYGMGKAKLALSLGLELDAAMLIIERFHKEAPYISECTSLATGAAEKYGFVRSILGRKICYDMYQPQWKYGDKRFKADKKKYPPLPKRQAFARYVITEGAKGISRAGTYAAFNAVIQSSSADQVKMAMVALWENHRAIPILQVHDELNILVRTEEEARQYSLTMANAIKLSVPSVVMLSVGKRWGESEEVPIIGDYSDD